MLWLAAAALSTALNGKMAQFAHLVGGSWNCKTHVPATEAAPAHEDRSTAIFEVVSGGVVHDHISADDYSGDFYIGYDQSANHYWLTGADSLGTDVALRSADGLHYDGASSMLGITMKDAATYVNVTPNETTAHEVFTRPGAEAIFDTDCAREGT